MGVLQNVGEGCNLVTLEEVDYPHHVVEVVEPWVHGALLPSGTVDALSHSQLTPGISIHPCRATILARKRLLPNDIV